METLFERILKLAVLACAALLATGASGAARPAQTVQTPEARPNILFILADNLGYGEIGVYGGGVTRGAPTPRIDKLASEGLRLTNMNRRRSARPAGRRS